MGHGGGGSGRRKRRTRGAPEAKRRLFRNGPFFDPSDDVPKGLDGIRRRVDSGDSRGLTGRWTSNITPDLSLTTSNFMVQTQVVEASEEKPITFDLNYLFRSLSMEGVMYKWEALPSIYIRSNRSRASVQMFNTGMVVLTGHADVVESVRQIRRLVDRLQTVYRTPLTYVDPAVNSVIVHGKLPNHIDTARLIRMHNLHAKKDAHFGGARVSDSSFMQNRWIKVMEDGTVRHAGGRSLKTAHSDIRHLFHILHACQYAVGKKSGASKAKK